ncbi:Autophagy-related protein [Trema orientale]|uniref:Ubiquitin-like-conjugating enzyme ATG10 n=1 Tax=Trema orientale TaxID=63057 RepID=A0A2P5CY07_TREOI|nr:Autophagy-related protein [Trema orientale]
MDVFSWDGTISSRDFYAAARAFADKWNRSNHGFPPWTWAPSPKHHHLGLPLNQVNGYLILEKLCLAESTDQENTSSKVDLDELTQARNEEVIFSKEEEPVDSATLVEGNSDGVHYYDFHIVYSASYRVPVLYFRAYCNDGQPLVLDEIEKDLPASSAKVLLESKWTFITQEEHPHLNRPWYKLHPCGTSEWMKLLFQSDTSLAKNGASLELYLVSWLSVVGQVVGLKIPSELLKH